MKAISIPGNRSAILAEDVRIVTGVAREEDAVPEPSMTDPE